MSSPSIEQAQLDALQKIAASLEKIAASLENINHAMVDKEGWGVARNLDRIGAAIEQQGGNR